VEYKREGWVILNEKDKVEYKGEGYVI